MKLLRRILSFGGQLQQFKVKSTSCPGYSLHFTAFLPSRILPSQRYPVLYFLGGYEWSDLDFFALTGANEALSKLPLITVSTSLHFESDSDEMPKIHQHGFYVDSKQIESYQLFTFATKELPSIIEKNFPADPSRKSIFGTSTGGTAALLAAIKLRNEYKSVSAFRPFANPSQTKLGQEAFKIYFGNNSDLWKKWDPVEALEERSSPSLSLSPPCPLIDQGAIDEYHIFKELQPEALRSAFKKHDFAITLRLRAGYDQSSFFISTFMKEHINHHQSALIN